MPAPKPDTEEHRRLLSMLTRSLRASENSLSSRHQEWRRAERTYRLYVNPDELQEPKEAVTEESQLLYTYSPSIVVPLSYALTQTVISFWIGLFTSEQLPFRIDPNDPQSRGPARAQELLLRYQLDYVGFVPMLYAWLLDACRYGVGIVKNTWDTIYRNQTIRRFIDFPGPEGPIRIQVKEKREVLEYEGNIPEPVDPFQWRPDPRWPISQFQRGSVCGESLYRSYFELLARQREGLYENIEDIPRLSDQHLREQHSDRDRIMNANRHYGFFDFDYRKNRDAIVLVEELSKDIVPREFGLAESSRVERWLFAIANRAVIIRADPFPYDHNDFTYAAIESSPDWHSFTNPGLLEIMEPVHQHITWFVNSMLENARKSLNDRLVVDPQIVNMDDILAPSAGKAIRVNPDFQGIPGSVRNGVMQLKVDDIAAQGFQHVGFLVDLLQRISAANETLQGQVQQEERTATEISTVAGQGANRLRVLARLFSATGLVPLARQMVQNNMQLMTQEQYFKVVGSLERDFQGVGRAVQGGGILIAPEDIQGSFSFPVSDASAPLDPVRFARTWVQVLQVSLQNPMLAQLINLPEVWKELIRAMGIQDPGRLLLPQVQVLPDQQIQQQVQAGNLIPQPGPQPGPRPGGDTTPPLRAPIPFRPEMQSINGEERRPL